MLKTNTLKQKLLYEVKNIDHKAILKEVKKVNPLEKGRRRKVIIGFAIILFLVAIIVASVAHANPVGPLIALSPGIALLIIGLKAHVGMFWLPIFSAFAIADWWLDKHPGLASINQFFEHILVVLASGIASGGDPSVILSGVIMQTIRQVYTAKLDLATFGISSPVRSAIEDIVAVLGLLA